MSKDTIIAVSILTADFLNLKDQLDKIIAAKIPAIHFDIMDNHFVPNLTFGPKILSDVSEYLKDTEVVIDCHLMVEIKPSIKVADYLNMFVMSAVNSVTLHYEALSEKQREEFINWKTTVKKGIAINPYTKIDVLNKYLDKLDLVLIMSVNPGFGRQEFIPSTYEKIELLVKKIQTSKFNKRFIIAVDGGVNNLTAKKCITAGANYLVSGSYLLNSKNSIEEQVKQLLSNE